MSRTALASPRARSGTGNWVTLHRRSATCLASTNSSGASPSSRSARLLRPSASSVGQLASHSSSSRSVPASTRAQSRSGSGVISCRCRPTSTGSGSSFNRRDRPYQGSTSNCRTAPRDVPRRPDAGTLPDAREVRCRKSRFGENGATIRATSLIFRLYRKLGRALFSDNYFFHTAERNS